MTLVNQVGQLHRDAVLPPQIRRQPHIFGRQRRGKPRLKVVGEQVAWELFGEPPVAAAAVGNDIGQRFQRHARLHPQRQRLGHQHSNAH